MTRKVLIVDDDRILLNLTENKFKKYESSFSILTAEDGLQATEKLKKHTVSLVVTDLHMPRMDGFALLRTMGETSPSFAFSAYRACQMCPHFTICPLAAFSIYVLVIR